MSEGTFSIPLDDEIIKFRQHLETNDRVIFSAQFGDGKTTFLKEFIESQKDCFFIILHPVNYSVATNEDIFEYIKRDILVQLNEKKVLPELDLDAILGNIKSWQYFEPVLSFVLNQVPYGPFVKKAIDIGKKIKEDYDIKKNTFGKYEESFVNQRGGLYEDDGYTQLIKAGIHHIQTNKEGKKVILIIEDLDRIDPGHLFRILNVLGAHIDTEESNKNKFGFDKIIAVLDYNVTRHIFAHFYGQEANYEGYMSKFFSHYKYDYSITKVAQEYLREYIKEKTRLSDSVFSIEIREKVGYESFFLSDYINNLSVRRIVQILDGFENVIDNEKIAQESCRTDIRNSPIFYILALLVRLNVKYDSRTIYRSINQNGFIVPLLWNILLQDGKLQYGTYFKYGKSDYCVNSNRDLPLSLFLEKVPLQELMQIEPLNEEIRKSAFQLACSYIRDFKYTY